MTIVYERKGGSQFFGSIVGYYHHAVSFSLGQVDRVPELIRVEDENPGEVPARVNEKRGWMYRIKWCDLRQRGGRRRFCRPVQWRKWGPEEGQKEKSAVAGHSVLESSI